MIPPSRFVHTSYNLLFLMSARARLVQFSSAILLNIVMLVSTAGTGSARPKGIGLACREARPRG